MYELLPDKDCKLCPRLKSFIDGNREKFPDKYNAPVPSFGPKDAAILIVGLAPGLKGANFTGRPFTGDYAGDLLYGTLLKFGLAKGDYGAHKDDGLELISTRITNAVKCVPPQNKVTGDEINTCLQFLKREMAGMPNLKIILSLGLVSHNAVLKATNHKQSAFKFAHGAVHNLGKKTSLHGLSVQSIDHMHTACDDVILLIDSYHCSRYNTNTGRLTKKMFEAVFKDIVKNVV